MIKKSIFDLEFEVKIKLQKDRRKAEKSLKFLLKKPIEIPVEKSGENSTKVNKEEEEIDLTQLIVIENEFMGITDLIFKSSLLDPSIDMLKYKYEWNIPHFKSNVQYLNGKNEINLRIKYSDLLHGINKIDFTIINPETKKEFYKTIGLEKGLPPYGGSCFVSPSLGFSLLTEFTFIISDWKSSAMPLFYKIKYLNINNIPVDISNGGFVGSKFTTNTLPVANSFILEITDNQGISKTSLCNVNVKINKNIKEIDFYTKNIFDIPQKLLMNEIYKTNKNKDYVELAAMDKAVDMIDVYFDSIDQKKFITEYDIIISTLIEVSSQEFSDEKIAIIYKILNLIVKFIDPLLNYLPKLQSLYSILDNINKKCGELLKSNLLILNNFRLRRSRHFRNCRNVISITINS